MRTNFRLIVFPRQPNDINGITIPRNFSSQDEYEQIMEEKCEELKEKMLSLFGRNIEAVLIEWDEEDEE